ncbi:MULTISPECIES: hypothetical protein [unclassified Paraburkholderia]|uniref:hypothetical protein n=1 Tax=unclassified Paraburkholderia TaxID=2615204 RepID=UPI002AB2531D|nr:MULTISPECIES: hypothetical protein [unclassified Paraburkholderia]
MGLPERANAADGGINATRDALAVSDDTLLNDSIKATETGLSTGDGMALQLVIRALVPNIQLVLTPDYETDKLGFVSNGPDRLKLEDYQKRMDWIQTAALKYDGLVNGRYSGDMRTYLETIKSWGDDPDKR